MAHLHSIFDIRGNVGSYVFRRVRKNPIVSSTLSSETTSLSPVQKKNRQRFKNAVAFAKAMLNCEAGRAFYEELALRNKLNSAYQAAFTDYCDRISEGH